MIDFSETIPAARRAVEAALSATAAPAPAAVTIVRDLKGKISLFIEFSAEPEATLEARLNMDLAAALGCFWGGRLWLDHRKAPAIIKSFGTTVRQERVELGVSGSSPAFAWYLIDRTYSKRGWLEQRPLPWPHVPEKSPAIVSFYSFKGGVGRSTALAASSMILARAGKKVVVVDLDLEAPGVFSLLAPEARVDEGVVDYLVHKSVGDDGYRFELCARMISDPSIIGEAGRPITVLPAGRIDSGYIDKIARIDLNGDEAAAGLSTLLLDARRELGPDFIFLDVRAGLHDIGGLSLNAFSHLNLLFCLDTPQSWNGLYPVLDILSKAKDRELLLVHAMAAPPTKDPRAHEKFRSKAYEAFREHYFTEDEEMPDIDDESAPYGVPLYTQDSLMNLASLALPGVRDSLLEAGSPYRLLVRKIGERLGRSTE